MTTYQEAAESLKPNKGQWAAYESKGHCVVLAGPGSGKTKTLTLKLARMLHEDVREPRGIACVTYSNACVQELKSRLASLGVRNSRNLYIGTVHSFCFTQLARPYAKLGKDTFPSDARVVSAGQRDVIFAKAVNSAIGDENPVPWSFRVGKFRRNQLDRDVDGWDSEDPDAASVLAEYLKLLHSEGLVDFDDMVEAGLRLVERHEWARQCVKARFPILLVDEYQDLGAALHRLVLSLCFKAGVRLFAVGDPDQSIYGFTGAQPELLKRLADREDVGTVELKLNYRSGSRIIKASEAVLAEDRGFASGNSEEGTLQAYEAENGIEEQARFAAETIVTEALTRRPGRTLGDIAILYKDKNDGEVVAAAVETHGWKYIRIDNGSPIPRNPLTLWLQDCAKWCSIGWSTGEPSLTDLVHKWLSVNRSISSDEGRRHLRKQLVSVLWNHRKPDELLGNWLEVLGETCIRPAARREKDLQDDLEAYERLLSSAQPGERLAEFTVSAFGLKLGGAEHLSLVTLHSAKGLEYDVVIMVGCEEGRLPNFSAKTDEALKEERRLFYVGVTRARHEIHLLFSGWYQAPWGKVQRGRSRFVDEILEATEAT